MSTERQRSRSSSSSDSKSRHSASFRQPDPFEVGETTLNLDDVSDQEIEALYFEDDKPDDSGFLNLPTVAGLSLIVVGIVYLLTQLGVWTGPDLSMIVEALPFIGGILVILLGFGVLNWRSSDTKSTSAVSKKADSPTSSSTDTSSEKKKRLYRSREEKKLMGVCGGLADYFNLDPTLVRIAFVVGVIASGGPFVVAYLVLGMFVMPKAPKKSAPEHKEIS